MKNDRTTFIIGAGAPLDLELPTDILKPSTANITQEVIKPYDDPLDKAKIIHIVSDVYYRLMDYYPHPKDIKPNINFEQVFHVLEMLWSYSFVWKRKCNNPKMFPPFAPFTDVIKGLTIDQISSSVFRKFITQIMDTVDGYDKEFRTNIERHKWYRDFFAHFGSENSGDFFNLNYDTTIEESIKGNFIDGYEDVKLSTACQMFNPKKLFNKANNISTISHLHGCINYFFYTSKNLNEVAYIERNYDLYKYFDYDVVKYEMSRWTMSPPNTQACDSYYPSPIITGLRKTDKLNCVPFDFYHAHLINCIVNSPKLVIIGYGFGDAYCNQILERMNFLHGEKRRIVLIDKWDIHDMFMKYRGGYFLSGDLPNDLWMYLCRVMQCACIEGVLADLFRDGCEGKVINESKAKEKKVLRSKNGCVMVLPHGFKEATYAIDEIENFLNG